MSNEKLLAEFRIPNPAPRSHSIWTAQPLPASAAEGGLQVTLTRFRAYQTSQETRETQQVYPRTECFFRVQEKTQETLDWTPVLFEVSDATGNHWRPPPTLRFGGVESGKSAFLGALWAGESAWKLRVEFKRTANFPDSELLRIPNIRIPAANDIDELHTRYDWNGANLEVVRVIGADVEWDRVSLFNPERKRGCITVLVAGEILSANRQLTFVGATDEQGHRIELAGHGEPRIPESPVPFSFVFQPSAGARELNLVVAVSERRFLDFLAKPEQMKE